MEILIAGMEMQVDGRTSVTYVLRKGKKARCVDVLLDAGVDPVTYGKENTRRLWKQARNKDITLGQFNAAKERQFREIHLAAIFEAFNALKLGGGVPEMVLAAKQAYQASDEKIAEVLAFEAKYKQATEAERQALAALAIYGLSALLGGGR